MPPKANKKKADETKKKLVDDKTFGLKNKKKSKKVQNYVETVKKQASQKVDGPKRSNRAGPSAVNTARMTQMAARLAELELMNNPTEAAKNKILSEEELERKRREEEEEAERIRIANLPVEDQIEEERAKLKTKTPVNLELFLKWKEEKDKERALFLEAQKATAMKKMSKSERSRGQGLTGRELFQANAEIFVDDEEADDTALKAANEYIGSDDENGQGSEDGHGETGVQADASLFGGEPGTDDTEPEKISEAVGVGDESLFT